LSRELTFTEADVIEILDGPIEPGMIANIIEPATIAERINARLSSRMARLIVTHSVETIAAGEVVPVAALTAAAG